MNSINKIILQIFEKYEYIYKFLKSLDDVLIKYKERKISKDELLAFLEEIGGMLEDPRISELLAIIVGLKISLINTCLVIEDIKKGSKGEKLMYEYNFKLDNEVLKEKYEELQRKSLKM
jgi:hypothetical protein